MNTLGFSDMRIVGKMDLREAGLRKTAYGSHSLFENVSMHSDLKAALSDVDLSIGTTAKKRTTRKDVVEAVDLSGVLQSKAGTAHHCALVFGSEENGLSKAQLELCDIVSTIPLAVSYPSLNLAQSVLIYLWELSKNSMNKEVEEPEEITFRTMMQKADDLLQSLELDRSPVLNRRVKDRLALLTDTDTRLLLTVLSKLENKLKNG